MLIITKFTSAVVDGRPHLNDFECIATLGPSTTYFTDDSVTAPGYNTQSHLAYYVTVVDDMSNEHNPSNWIIVRVPTAPQNLQVTAPEPSYYPVLTWNDNPELDIDGYNVYKKLILPDSTNIPYAKQNVEISADTTWTDTTFIAFHGGAETAYYHVTAVNEINGESNPSMRFLAKVERLLEKKIQG